MSRCTAALHVFADCPGIRFPCEGESNESPRVSKRLYGLSQTTTAAF